MRYTYVCLNLHEHICRFRLTVYVIMERDQIVSCVVCKKQEQDVNKIISCMYCFSVVHFKCKNITGNAVNRAKANMYFCTVSCCEIYKRIVEMQNSRSSTTSKLAAELKDSVASAVVAHMNQLKSEVRLVTAAIEKSQDFLSMKFDEIVSDFNKLKTENEALKKQVSQLSQSHAELMHFVYRLEDNVDKSDRKAVSNHAVLLGIPVVGNENTLNLVDKTLSHIGVTLPPNSIASATRITMNNKPNALAPIRISFKEKSLKETVLSKKKSVGTILSTNIDRSLSINGRGTKVIIRDELTPLSMDLLREMRDYQESFKIKFVWPARSGGILVKKDEDAQPDLIKTRQELRTLIERYSRYSKLTSSPLRKKTA